MTGNSIPVLFPSGKMFECILRFAKFLESKRTKNVKSLDVNFDFLDKGLNNICLMETYVDYNNDLKLRFYASAHIYSIFTDCFWSWPCPNLQEFGFVLNLHHHKFQKHHEQDWVVHEIKSMFHKLRNTCPNLKTLNITVYPQQPNFKKFFLGLLESFSKWLFRPTDSHDIYDKDFYIGDGKPPETIAKLNRLKLKVSLQCGGRRNLSSYLGAQIEKKIKSMKNVEMQVIPNHNEERHECVRGFCWAIHHPEDPEPVRYSDSDSDY